jgi:recombination protein RecA
MKIGVMFGNPETTTGGNALKFYASVRLDIRKIESIKDGQEVSGNRVRVKVVKNKVAPPFRQAEFDVLFNVGISKAGEVLDMGVEKKLIEKSGAWYSYKGERVGQGRDQAVSYLMENKKVMVAIEEALLQAAGLRRPASPQVEEEGVEARETVKKRKESLGH